MKKSAAVFFIWLSLMLIANLARAELYSYSTEDNDFDAKFWKEMFKGGGPDQPGNEWMAVGDGFIIKKFTRESAGYAANSQMNITTYTGGEIILNSSGPWINKGKLKATNISAAYFSYPQNLPLVGEFEFILRFSGKFDNADLWFYAIAAWSGTPEIKFDDLGTPVFQRGTENLEIAFFISDYDFQCGQIVGYEGDSEWINKDLAEDGDWATAAIVNQPNKQLYMSHPYDGYGERTWEFRYSCGSGGQNVNFQCYDYDSEKWLSLYWDSCFGVSATTVEVPITGGCLQTGEPILLRAHSCWSNQYFEGEILCND